MSLFSITVLQDIVYPPLISTIHLSLNLSSSNVFLLHQCLWQFFPTLLSSCVYVSHLSLSPFYFNAWYFIPSPSASNLFASNLFLRHYQSHFSFCFLHSLFLSHTTDVSVTAGHLLDFSFTSHPLTSISFPSLLLTNTELWTALAVPLWRKRKKGPSLVVKRLLFSVKIGTKHQRRFILFQRLKQHNHKLHEKGAQTDARRQFCNSEKRCSRLKVFGFSARLPILKFSNAV